MPANVVKNSSDEKHWQAAKKAYEHAVKLGKKPTNKWAYIMEIFEKMKGGKSSKASVFEALAAELGESPNLEAATPSKNDVLKGLQDIKKNLARFGELHWHDAQEFLGPKSQRLVDAVDAINDAIKSLGGGITPNKPSGISKPDFGTGPKPELELGSKFRALASDEEQCSECNKAMSDCECETENK